MRTSPLILLSRLGLEAVVIFALLSCVPETRSVDVIDYETGEHLDAVEAFCDRKEGLSRAVSDKDGGLKCAVYSVIHLSRDGYIPIDLRVDADQTIRMKRATLSDEVQEVVGVGIALGPRVAHGYQVRLASPESMLRAGDTILKVDGEATLQLSPNEVRDMLLGPANTIIKIAIERDGKTSTIAATRRRYSISSSLSATNNNQIVLPP